jgi:phage head maturation protease
MNKPAAMAAFTGALPLQVRLADTGSSFNQDTRELDVIVSTGAAVTRARMDGWDVVRYSEELLVNDAAVNMERLNAGAAVLDSHDAYGGIGSSLGVVQRAWIEGGNLMANIRLHAEGVSPAADALAGMIRGGTAPKISVGYSLDKVRVVEAQKKTDMERWIVERWTPFEVSFVTVPADAGAGVRSSDQTYPCEVNRATPPNSKESHMDNHVDNASAGTAPVENRAAAPAVDAVAVRAEAVKVERERASTINALAAAHKLPADMVSRALADGTAVDAFRASVLDHLATAQEATPTVTATSRASGDDPAVIRSAMSDALVGRILRKAPEGDHARTFMDHGFADLAAELMGDKRRLNAARREDVLYRAFHTTSDFPSLLENVANKVLLARYNAAMPTYRMVGQSKTFTDFKAHSMVRPGDFPNLLAVGETGEIKAGTVSESKETISLATYARQIRLSRNLLVNDDLNAMGDILGSIGQRISDFENATFWAKVVANPTLATDNKAVFQAADHLNYVSSGTAIDVTSLGVARAAMMKQTSLDGIKLNIGPKFLVTGPDRITKAESITTPINPTASSDVNVFGPRLTPIADANISGNGWYLFSEPSMAATFVYGYLEGAAGPQIRTDEPFGVLGMAMQVVLDFAVGAIDYRGAYFNAGA